MKIKRQDQRNRALQRVETRGRRGAGEGLLYHFLATGQTLKEGLVTALELRRSLFCYVAGTLNTVTFVTIQQFNDPCIDS